MVRILSDMFGSAEESWVRWQASRRSFCLVAWKPPSVSGLQEAPSCAHLEVGAAVRRAFLLQAVQLADLRKAAARKGQSLVMNVDVLEARRILQAVPDAASRGACGPSLLETVWSGP